MQEKQACYALISVCIYMSLVIEDFLKLCGSRLCFAEPNYYSSAVVGQVGQGSDTNEGMGRKITAVIKLTS